MNKAHVALTVVPALLDEEGVIAEWQTRPQFVGAALRGRSVEAGSERHRGEQS